MNTFINSQKAHYRIVEKYQPKFFNLATKPMNKLSKDEVKSLYYSGIKVTYHQMLYSMQKNLGKLLPESQKKALYNEVKKGYIKGFKEQGLFNK